MNYKQQSNQGCLVVDLMYLFGIEPTIEAEKELISAGLFQFREIFSLGCLLAFEHKYKNSEVIVYVDNKYFLKDLQSKTNNPNITLLYQKNDLQLLNYLEPPYIVYVDYRLFYGWSHQPHFIMVTKKTANFFKIFDPWDGKTKQISKIKLIDSINSLRNHIKVCPLVITKKLV